MPGFCQKIRVSSRAQKTPAGKDTGAAADMQPDEPTVSAKDFAKTQARLRICSLTIPTVSAVDFAEIQARGCGYAAVDFIKRR